MIVNTDCTILTRSTDSKKRQYEWSKTIYKNVYFESTTNSARENPKSENSCYCCIYGITTIDANIDDIIVKGELLTDDFNITDIKKKYEAYNIRKIAIYDIGNSKHIEIEGA